MVELWTENCPRRNLLQPLEEYPNKHILAAKKIPPVDTTGGRNNFIIRGILVTLPR